MINKNALMCLLNNYSKYKWHTIEVQKSMPEYKRLEDALELMRKSERKGELYYQIIGNRYIFNFIENDKIRTKLGLSERSFYRYQKNALEFLRIYY